MSDTQASKDRSALIVSAIGEDGTMVETLFRPQAGETALAIARSTGVEVASQWMASGREYVPVRATNNLLKHGALLLPSEIGEYGTEEELVAEVKAYIARYVALPEAALDVSAAYVLLSWVYDAFNEVPYLRYRGDYGTGKSRSLLVVGSLCHKVFFASGASTVSPIFHTQDLFRGTLVFDEADFRFSDENAELVKILNNGNLKGFPVLRTQVTQRKEFDPRAFHIFGPKIIGMRRSYQDRALESRFLTIEMEPGRADGVPINLPDRQKDEALALRNKLLSYRLRNRLSIRLDPTLADLGLEPRMNQILLPLLAVAPTERMRASVRDMAHTIQAAIVSHRGTSTEGQLLSVLGKLMVRDGDGSLALSEIAAAFVEQYGREYERPITNRWIGSVLRRLGIALYKGHGVVTMVPGQIDRVSALVARYGVGIAREDESRSADAALREEVAQEIRQVATPNSGVANLE